MLQTPTYISALFLATTLLTLFFLYKACHGSKALMGISVCWILLQAYLVLSGFYDSSPRGFPRFFFLAGPPVIAVIILNALPSGRIFVRSMNLEWCIWLQVVRVPVEIVLFCLYLNRQVPEIMTFSGGNLDLLSGLSAPFIWWAIRKSADRSRLVRVWNWICLALLLNIVVRAVLSAPSPIQQFAFDQPNIAILHFPFVFLPGFIVPSVLMCQLAIFAKKGKSVQFQTKAL
jgi:hypothetical protein